MQRRNFVPASIATVPLVNLPALAPASAPTEGFVVKAGEDQFQAPIKAFGTSPNLVKLSGKDTNGQLAAFEYEGLAKMGPPLHLHLNQDETFYVLEGDYLFQVGEQKHTLRAGDTIFLPRNIAHTWLQLTDRGKLMYVLQPADKMEEFFKKMNSLSGPPTAELVEQIHADHEMSIVGPPLSLVAL